MNEHKGQWRIEVPHKTLSGVEYVPLSDRYPDEAQAKWACKRVPGARVAKVGA